MFTLIAYKPSADEVAMGHVLGRYNSDFKLHVQLDQKPLTILLADVIFENVRDGSKPAKFGIVVLDNGVPIYDTINNKNIPQNLADSTAQTARNILMGDILREADRIAANTFDMYRKNKAAHEMAINAENATTIVQHSLEPKPIGFSNWARSNDPAQASADARRASKIANQGEML